MSCVCAGLLNAPQFYPPNRHGYEGLITQLQRLETLELGFNHLGGPLPEMWALHKLEWLGLSNNSFSGEISDDIRTFGRAFGRAHVRVQWRTRQSSHRHTRSRMSVRSGERGNQRQSAAIIPQTHAIAHALRIFNTHSDLHVP